MRNPERAPFVRKVLFENVSTTISTSSVLCQGTQGGEEIQEAFAEEGDEEAEEAAARRGLAQEGGGDRGDGGPDPGPGAEAGGQTAAGHPPPGPHPPPQRLHQRPQGGRAQNNDAVIEI